MKTWGNSNKHRGFTLVEMIVVIAIIAILAAVIIPTTAGFVDRARLSNDRQNAARMNRVLEIYDIEHDNVDLEGATAHEIRTILNAFSDTPFIFETEARDAGFFYLSQTQRIVAAKYDAIGGIELGLEPAYNLLRWQTAAAAPIPGPTPEELFGAGRILFSTGGNQVAQVVFLLSNLMPESSNLTADYESLEAYVNDGVLPDWITRVFRGERHTETLTTLLENFHPNQTLYINNAFWSGKDNGVPARVVFSPGISHLPNVPVDVGQLPVPKTIRTTDLPPESIVLGENTSVRPISDSDDSLVDYSAFVVLTQDGSNTTFDLAGLPIRDRVIQYSVVFSGSSYRLRIFTDEGFVGFATNRTTIIYHLNHSTADHNITFFSKTVMDGKFSNPAFTPTRNGHTFSGWWTTPEGQGIELEPGNPLPNLETRVYARWTSE